jgi:predicted phosphate transport protein (TIGR00153 family)
MLSLLKLFSKSPFAPLQIHMDKVANCVGKVKEIFLALQDKDYKKVESLSKQISDLEHEADLTKNDIRNHLTKGLFLVVDRRDLLEILSIQDSIADKAEDIGVILSLRPLLFEEMFQTDFNSFLEKNLQSFQGVMHVVRELDELLETSFGGLEAEKVKQMVEKVAYLEHEADLLQQKLLHKLYNDCDHLSPPLFHIWNKIFEEVGALSNLSEKLANRIRMLLEVK